MSEQKPHAILRKDYRVPDFLIDEVDLDFDLREEESLVRAQLALRRNPEAEPNERPLRLDGQKLELRAIALDGRQLGPDEYRVDETGLTLADVPDAFALTTTVALRPQDNTALEGLYKSGGNFCTQCEAEGFRRITYFLDRPDVMARYRVRVEADAARYPALLSNGNLVEEGDAPDGRRYAVWEDPFPKPSYLFALVAGKLTRIEDVFATRSGRKIDLHIYVRPGDEDKCAHAMESLKRSMKWDEDRYGLEYDLDIFQIVAVSDFNMGAMENKGLNIFNTKYVLARPDTATDMDYALIEAIIGHEYFHNWTGNRVTCRDWFQLSLKEGLTVFRDQEFSADMGSAGVKRVEDVRRLRMSQLPEDAGPTAHPVRPDSYIEINNFYTATVYEKGAEVVRMYQTLLGRDGFRKGMDLYFQRHDGQAVTCDDFRAAMADANGVDLSQFELWYSQSGTPVLSAEGRFDAASRSYALTLRQSCPPTPGQPDKAPFHMPVAVGLLGSDGRELPLRLEGEDAAGGTTRVLDLREAERTFRFVDLPEAPIPSLLRGFSAPVRLEMERADSELAFLLAHDADPFARWEAGQELATRVLLRAVKAIQAGKTPEGDGGLAGAFAIILDSGRGEGGIDPDYAALLTTLPGEDVIAQRLQPADVDAIHAAREHLRTSLAAALRDRLQAAYDAAAEIDPFAVDGVARGRRALKNLALSYLTAGGDPEGVRLAAAQFAASRNMTDSVAALLALNNRDAPEREEAFAAFRARWADDPLVLDKWFMLQAGAALPSTLDRVKGLMSDPAFDVKNPNKARALLGGFGANLTQMHRRDGAGYRFLADQILAIDKLNPQTASRLLPPLTRWRKFNEERQKLMRAELERIVAEPGLSPDCYEIASKSLA